MKFGVREICDVVLKAKANQKVGNKTFYKGEPVIYFDTLKTSSMEGAATTVYAQGGRGNARLMAWEGERTVTFTMEDALISPAGFMILSGAGLTEGTDAKPIPVHVAETTNDVKITETGEGEARVVSSVEITVKQPVSTDDNASIYVMVMKDGEIISEPFIGKGNDKTITISADSIPVTFDGRDVAKDKGYAATDIAEFFKDCAVMVDYYTDKTTGAFQIDITPDKFGGNYYLEASTLFRDTNGVDMPAEFIIPNCKIQSNFTFTMASSGDPSTFTFTMDAFPDYTRFDNTKKVLAAIQVITEGDADGEAIPGFRNNTNAVIA
jgi:hypothetical protein